MVRGPSTSSRGAHRRRLDQRSHWREPCYAHAHPRRTHLTRPRWRRHIRPRGHHLGQRPPSPSSALPTTPRQVAPPSALAPTARPTAALSASPLATYAEPGSTATPFALTTRGAPSATLPVATSRARAKATAKDVARAKGRARARSRARTSPTLGAAAAPRTAPPAARDRSPPVSPPLDQGTTTGRTLSAPELPYYLTAPPSTSSASAMGSAASLSPLQHSASRFRD